jgi:hypothetical protein
MMTQPIVHIIFTLSGGGLLRQALRKAGRDDEVVEIWHNLNVGPIDPSDPAGRAKWLEKEIGRTEPEDTAPSERASIEADFSDHQKVAWFTRRSAMEYAGFLDWLWHRDDGPCDIVDLTDVEIAYPPREGPPGPWILPSLALLNPNIIHRNKLWDLARRLPMTERLGYRELWGQCQAENALLRLIEGDKIVSTPISFFDSLLMSYVTDKWRRISMIFSSITNSHWNDGVWQTEDAFLTARIRTLVESGCLEIRGETARNFALGEVRLVQEP